MDEKALLSMVDHTNLAVTARWEDIKRLCDEAITFGCASVCVAPCYVKDVKNYVGDRMKITTVIGFPNGYATGDVKCFEAADAVKNGADEIDMVINIGYLKDGKHEKVEEEIKQVKAAIGEKTLKVIVETCLLSEAEKEAVCAIVARAGADFIKTSTGFSTGGATKEDVALFSRIKSPSLKIKAAGGIKTLTDAAALTESGASRLGTSRIVGLIKEKKG